MSTRCLRVILCVVAAHLWGLWHWTTYRQEDLHLFICSPGLGAASHGDIMQISFLQGLHECPLLSNIIGPDLTELRGFLPFIWWSQFQIASHQQGLVPVVFSCDISRSPTIFLILFTFIYSSFMFFALNFAQVSHRFLSLLSTFISLAAFWRMPL